MVVGSFNAWWPREVVFVVEENVAVVGVDGAGEFFSVHFRASEAGVGGRSIGGH